MNASNTALSTGNQTMSSTEIAQLTGKRKNDIHQDIKAQLFIGLYGLKDGGNFHHDKIQGLTVILDNRSYWSEVQLDRYHTDILISGYEVKYRAAIVKRWHELEDNQYSPLSQKPQQPKLPNVSREFKAALQGAKLFGLKGNQALLCANKAVKTVTGVDFQNLLGVELSSPAQERLMTPSDIGNQIGLSGMKVNQLLKEKGLQIDTRDSKNQIVWIPTDKGKAYADLQDTNKKHSNGTPIQQMKWFANVVDVLQGTVS